MQKPDFVRLQHMLEAAKEALHFVSDRNRADLDTSRMLVLAIIKDIEIIGEAASKVTEGTRADYPEIPWKEVIEMRNRLIHAYFNIDLDRVWETVMGDLPPLTQTLNKIVSDYWRSKE